VIRREAIGVFGSQGELVMRFCSNPLGAALGIAAVAAVTMATPGRAQQGPGDGQPSPARHLGYRTGSSAIVLAKVNLRSGPGTDSEILASIPPGSTIDVGKCEGEWCAVTWNGQSGYAIARNLDLGGLHQASSDPPPAQPGGYAEGYDHPPGAYSPPAQPNTYAEGHDDYPPGAYPPPAQPNRYAEGHDYPPGAYPPPAQPGRYAEGLDYPPGTYGPEYFAFYGRPVVYGRAYYYSPGRRWRRHWW
jgi:hypothetical protein